MNSPARMPDQSDMEISAVDRGSGFTLWGAWKADLARYRPPVTARLYGRTGYRVGADLGGSPATWTADELAGYLESLTPAMAKLVRQALSDWLDWCVRHGIRDANPLAALPPHRGRRRGRRIRRALTPDELRRLAIAVAVGPRWSDEHGDARARVALMVIAQANTGLRPGEICRMLTSHVHLAGPHPRIEVVETKTGDDREVPLNATARAAFAELVRDRAGRISNVETATYWEHVSRAAAAIGLPPEKRRPYALRHTFATWLIRAGVHQRTAAGLLGHADLRSIAGYTVADYDQLRAGVDRLDGYDE